MPVTSKELRERRAKIIRDARAIRDKADTEARDLTAEERQKWAALMGDVGPDGKRIEGEEEKLLRQISDVERQERLEEELRAPQYGGGGGGNRIPGSDTPPNDQRSVVITEEQRSLAFAAWVMHQTGRTVRSELEEAADVCGVNYRQRDLVLNLRRDNYSRMRGQFGVESRAGAANPQYSTLLASGGVLVQEGFVNNLERALLQYGGIRNVADVMRTAGGNDLPWPTVNDTTVKGRLLQQNAPVNKSDVTFGAIVFHAYEYTSDMVLVPVALLEDAAVNLPDLIGSLCGERIARIQADHFTTGSGAAQPLGIIPAATSGVTAATATAIAADDLYTLKHSVDPAYRAKAAWMMHDQILLAIKKLKDGFGRYLWQTGLAGGAGDTIDGQMININMSMDSTLAATKKTVAYGDFSKYKIRDVSQVRLRRLVERFADSDQEAFIMFQRGDGNLLDAGTHPVKYMKQS